MTRLSKSTAKHILYCRITINSLRQEFSISIEVPQTVKWNKRKQACEAKTHEAAFINGQIDKTRIKLRQINTSLDNQGIIITPDLVIAAYKNPTPFMKKMLLAKIERYIIYKTEVEKVAIRTQQCYRKFYGNLKEYLNYKDTFVENINIAWANRYSDSHKRGV